MSVADLSPLSSEATVPGTPENDTLVGSDAADVIRGEGGNDNLQGGRGNDQLYGGEGADELIGGAGNDTLDGGSGRDKLFGNSGDDVYILNRNNGFDEIFDSLGNDTIQIDDTPAEVIFSVIPGSGILLIQLGEAIASVRGFFSTTDEGRIENFAFSDGTVWHREDILDLLEGQSPPPSEPPKPPTEEPPPPPPPPSEEPPPPSEEPPPPPTEDPPPPLPQEEPVPPVTGTDGDDVLIGTSRGEVIEGYAGDDTLDGGGGEDALVGGHGNDVYVWGAGKGSDVIVDTGGVDTLRIAARASDVVLALDDDMQSLEIKLGNEVLTIAFYFVTGESEEEESHIENIVFSDGTIWHKSDVIAALGGETPPPPLEGGPVLGTAGNDTLDGTTGHDTLDGGAGDDLMKGEAGNDVYRWAFGSGNDTISDSRGIDTLNILANSSEAQFTATGDDYADLTISLHGQQLVIKNYFFTAEDGGNIENISFADGQVWQIDRVWKLLQVHDGSSRDDVIYGKAGKDNLKGNAGHDRLFGGGGYDVLNGGAGNDRLVGGTSADLLSGGTGKDVFVFGKSDTGLGKNRDVILDFRAKEDRIDLSGIDANSRTKADNTFGKLLSGKQKFTDAGQMRYDAKTGLLSLNTDKDAAAEFEIQLKNKPSFLKLSDFIL